jgi:NADPH:quinone reductase-like Zn-dependent oxidoreductase
MLTISSTAREHPMGTPTEHAILFTAKEQAALVPVEQDARPLGPREVAGHTLVSLVSAGTEVVGTYTGSHFQIGPESYPMGSGYACVFRVDAVGADVRSVREGEVVFCPADHRSYQRVAEGRVVRVPAGLAPEVAVFARMVKIPMPAFVHTAARPPETCVVTGLGVVGLMAAQLGQVYGYEVLACEPQDRRRRIAREHGVETLLPAVPVDDPAVCKHVGLALECSGHEQAALGLCSLVKPRGDVFLVGVPWVARSERLAHAVLHAVFYNYVNLHSGWEGRMPPSPEIHSEQFHFRAALDWLARGEVQVHESLYRKASPRDPQTQYQDILHNRLESLTVLFDWREL